MRVRFVASERLGGGMLRSFWPAEALRRRGVGARAEVWWPRPEEYETVVLHRPIDPAKLRQVRRYRDAGLRVLVDEDDDLEQVPEGNTIARELWTERARAAHAQAIAEADGLVVTTPRLMEIYGPLARRVHLCPNYLPERYGLLLGHRMKNDHRVLVGWAGITLTHAHDLEWIRPEVSRMLRGATFQTVGDRQSAALLGWGGDVEFWPFQEDIGELYRLMARADIGIVPLLPCAFNEAKSWLKALEYMTVGVPVVATDLPEQRRLITDGVDGFLARTPREFADRVQELVGDWQLRNEMGERARARAAELAIEKRADCWVEALGDGYDGESVKDDLAGASA